MDVLLAVLGWIVFGMIVGAVARLLIPGRDPIGFGGTILLGIVGSLVGGGVGWLIAGGGDRPYTPAGWILSIVGAVVALLTYYWATGHRRERI